MSIITMLIAVIALVLTLVAFIPLLGWLNWLFIPFSIIALLLNVIAIIIPPYRNKIAYIGVVISVMSLFVGIVRLSIGGGIF